MGISDSSENKIQKIEPIRIFDQAIDQIRNSILEGTLAPGEKLPTEHEMSRQLNIGRSSVREALRVLEAEGLIEVKRGLGTFVTTKRINKETELQELVSWLEKREETIEQVLQVREFVEGLTSSLAATRATDNTLTEIRSIVEKLSKKINELKSSGDECIKECLDELALLDASFHLAISEASENDIAIEIITHIIPAFNESNKAILYISKKLEIMDVEHRKILSALEARDPIEAEKAVRAHIRRVRSEIVGPY
jgi:GntR family transcriptional repressor for pyruvate dehydrogenase complex